MLEATRRFIAQIPLLSKLIETAFSETPYSGNNPDELRDHLSEVRRQIVAQLKEQGSLYRVECMPHETFQCPHCGAEGKSGYWEVCNSVTARRASFATRLMHTFMVHGDLSVNETVSNLSDIQMGEREIKLDVVALMQVFANADLPGEVQDELKAYAQERAAAAR
jgi:hypothetical protein